jgi:hypothetical protein
VSPVRYELGFYIPEDGILHSHRRENLKSYMVLTYCCIGKTRGTMFHVNEDRKYPGGGPNNASAEKGLSHGINLLGQTCLVPACGFGCMQNLPRIRGEFLLSNIHRHKVSEIQIEHHKLQHTI